MKYLKPLIYLAIGLFAFFITKGLKLTADTLNIFVAFLCAVLSWLIPEYFTSGRSEGSYKAQVSSLEKEKDKIISTSEQKISDFKKYNGELETKLLKYTHRETILSKYTHNVAWGYWTHNETSHNFCNKCLIDNDPPKEAPLSFGGRSWHCNICNSYYYSQQGEE